MQISHCRDELHAKKNQMAKQKFRTTRRSVFSRVKAYILYVEISKKCCNAGERTYCDAIISCRKHTYDCRYEEQILYPSPMRTDQPGNAME